MTLDKPATRLKAPKVAAAKRGGRVALGRVSHKLGHRSEWLAAALLMSRGYQILGFRLKTRGGEIDILARRGRILAVIEVKRRPTLEQALAALSPDQCGRLVTAGRAVLRQRPSLAGHQLRFDMVALAPGRFPRHRRGVVPFGRGRDDA